MTIDVRLVSPVTIHATVYPWLLLLMQRERCRFEIISVINVAGIQPILYHVSVDMREYRRIRSQRREIPPHSPFSRPQKHSYLLIHSLPQNPFLDVLFFYKTKKALSPANQNARSQRKRKFGDFQLPFWSSNRLSDTKKWGWAKDCCTKSFLSILSGFFWWIEPNVRWNSDKPVCPWLPVAESSRGWRLRDLSLSKKREEKKEKKNAVLFLQQGESFGEFRYLCLDS